MPDMSTGLLLALKKSGPSGGAAKPYLDKQKGDDYKMAFKDAMGEYREYEKKGDTDKADEAMKAAIQICFYENESGGYGDGGE